MTAFPKPERRGPKARKPLRRSGPIARQSPPPSMGRGVLPGLVRLADQLFSAIVRRTKVCEVCHRRRATDAAHHISRTFGGVRWTLSNASALCRRCHERLTVEPEAWREWWTAKVGRSVARELLVIANRGVHLSEPYMRDVVAALRAA